MGFLSEFYSITNPAHSTFVCLIELKTIETAKHLCKQINFKLWRSVNVDVSPTCPCLGGNKGDKGIDHTVWCYIVQSGLTCIASRLRGSTWNSTEYLLLCGLDLTLITNSNPLLQGGEPFLETIWVSRGAKVPVQPTGILEGKRRHNFYEVSNLAIKPTVSGIGLEYLVSMDLGPNF